MMNEYALLVECDPGTTLGGSCLRDVQNMATHLITRCGFLPQNIIIVTTSSVSIAKQIKQVTYHQTINVYNAYNELLDKKAEEKKAKKIIVLLSGHGFSVKDHNGDEKDGQDEAINIGTQIIIDDDIRTNIVMKAKQRNIKLILLSDTCHSGTMFDLLDKSDLLLYDAFSISACSDNQLSMCDVGETTGFGGSLTTAILVDGVLEDIVSFIPENINNGYEKIKKRLQRLQQTVIFSTEKW